MKKWHKVSVAGILGIFCCGILFWSVRPSRLTYYGRPLSAWLEDIASQNQLTRENAEKTFRQFGANIEPALTEIMETKEDSHFNLTLKALIARLSGRKTISEAERHWRVAKAFRALGESGSNAIPSLTKLLENRQNANKAAYALAGMGTKAVPALTIALTNSSPEVRLTAAGALGRLGADSKPAVLNLVGCLANKDAQLRQAAAQSLGQIAEMPEIVVPALISTLADLDETVRMSSAMALGSFGDSATTAIPDLFKLQRDTDLNVRLAATNSISQIATSLNKRSQGKSKM